MNNRAAYQPRRRELLTALAITAAGFPLISWASTLGTDNAGFPLEIRHAFGTSRIKTKPKRIAAIGWGSDEALLALGIVPVVMSKYWGVKDGILPWSLEKLGYQRPTEVGLVETDFEALALLEPDLILALRTTIQAHVWRRLERIAPTIPYRSSPKSTNWREIMETVGVAVGEPRKAADLIEETDRFLKTAISEYQNLRGKSFIFASYFPNQSTLDVFLPADGRIAILRDLGLEIPNGIAQIAERYPDRTEVAVSLELLDTLDADLLIVWYPPGGRAAAEGNSLFKRFRPVREGGYLALEDPAMLWVAVAPSVLSIPYGYSDFLARLSGVLTAPTEGNTR